MLQHLYYSSIKLLLSLHILVIPERNTQSYLSAQNILKHLSWQLLNDFVWRAIFYTKKLQNKTFDHNK